MLCTTIRTSEPTIPTLTRSTDPDWDSSNQPGRRLTILEPEHDRSCSGDSASLASRGSHERPFNHDEHPRNQCDSNHWDPHWRGSHNLLRASDELWLRICLCCWRNSRYILDNYSVHCFRRYSTRIVLHISIQSFEQTRMESVLRIINILGSLSTKPNSASSNYYEWSKCSYSLECTSQWCCIYPIILDPHYA